jgi:hypothetical protein
MSAYPIEPDPLAYYSPEAHFFSDLAQNFAETGQIHPEAFYLIIDWKAPRARTRHLRRLAGLAGSFEQAVSQIAADLHNALEPDQRLRVLMTKPWGFLLPTASAILTVLYPDTFTVYDRRVCKELVCKMLGNFDGLANMKCSVELWQEYQRFIAAVRAAAPSGSNLRDCDRQLWGQDKRKTMLDELASAGHATAT